MTAVRVAFAAATTLALASILGHAEAQQPPFVGDWLSDGYGYCARIDANELVLYEVTSISAIGQRRVARVEATAQFLVADLTVELEALAPTAGATAVERFALRLPGTASSIHFSRIADVPVPVTRPTPADPITTFEVFRETFATHYPFFALRGVDWEAACAAARPRINATTPPRELFAILRGLIEPLHDAHTSLEAPDLRAGFGGAKVVAQPLTRQQRPGVQAVIDDHYVQGKLTVGCNGRVKHGRLDARTGYLRIDGFGGYSPLPGFRKTLEALETTLDRAMEEWAGCEAAVIDVRLNDGGSDRLGVAIASRLTDREYVAFVKRARNDPTRADGLTEPQSTRVVPSSRRRFLGRVFLLTGPDSVSAAETFTMALLGRTPAVVRIGESTQGVYSDVLTRQLPNGWSFGLPNEIFFTEAGEHFEARGVPPDHDVPVFAPDDVAVGRDACLDRVFELIDDA